MSEIRSDDLKTGAFDTWSRLELRRGEMAKTVQVSVDHKAATRQAVIVALRKAGWVFESRSDWKAREPAKSPEQDWDYVGIAIHHAGNSYSCSAHGAQELRRAEATDIGTFGHVSYHYAVDCKGVIYEALDIRHKGAHIAGGNTGVIGIVMLADLSTRGEGSRHGPGIGKTLVTKGLRAGISELFSQSGDRVAIRHDEMSEVQLSAAAGLIKVLKEYFNIIKLGGHREFASKLQDTRACPGIYGMILAEMLRKEFSLLPP